jgi:hypothetical protein
VQPKSAKKEGAQPDLNSWQYAACYTYGYNHPLLVHRVHDVMSTLTMLKEQGPKPKRIILVASDGMGAVGALAAATLKDAIHGAAIDTEGFRFASLHDAMHPHFVPGAVKYGDIPGLLGQGDPARLAVLGENGNKGGTEAVASAALKLAGK